MIAFLKRWLRPFKPVLAPIWHWIRPRLLEANPNSFRNTRERWTARVATKIRAILHRPEPPIRPLRYHEIVELAARVPYYKHRIDYTEAAAVVARDLIRRRGLRSALELGPNLQPLIIGADVMDITDRPELIATGRRIIHDATSAPWPVDDRAFDLFVALQVFEHLGTSQASIFREVRRVARNAILSLPIEWVMDDPRNCHHMLTNEHVLGWFAPVVPTRVVVGNGGRRKRLIYVFEDLPVPDSAVPEGTTAASALTGAPASTVATAAPASTGAPASTTAPIATAG
ncbi:MAG: hypothetical protein H0V73_11715 [Chloroflexi bacterium]|nr:hypothetical protein [Chloroflexota bacterium]